MQAVDDYILDQVAQPALDRLWQATGVSCFAVARLAFLGAAACCGLACFVLSRTVDFGPLGAVAAFECLHQLTSALGVSRLERQAGHGQANPRKQEGKVARLGALALFLLVVSGTAILAPPGSARGILLWAFLFYGLVATGEYAVACQRPPPREAPRQVAEDGRRAASSISRGLVDTSYAGRR